jgi:methionyl-tRNA formyltransferase
MKIVYFGTSDFAVPALRALAKDVILVISQPERPSGRGGKLIPSPVKQAALELGLPVETPEKAKSTAFIDSIAALEADLIVVAAYGQILTSRLLASAKHGSVNLHGSILPKYRGAAPIQRSVLEGFTETGVTLIQMDKGMDTGDIIDIAKTAIYPDETYGELQTRLSHIAAEQISRLAPLMGTLSKTPQDHEYATYAAKIERSECELSCSLDVNAEYNRFRAFTPAPGAFIITSHGRLRLHEMRRSDANGTPGEVLRLNPFTIGFTGGALELITVQPEGKPKMKGQEWANGARLKIGTNILPAE